jgi:transcriptional regulator with XRE-family HTH domain
MTYFGDHLRAIRESVGMTQVELSEATGIDQRNLSAIERGKRPPSEETVLTLAKGLGVAADELLVKRFIDQISQWSPERQMLLLKGLHHLKAKKDDQPGQ